MKNIIITNSYTGEEIEVFNFLIRGGENFESAICTDDKSEVRKLYPYVKVDNYMDEFRSFAIVIETTNFIIFPRGFNYAYKGEGANALIGVLREFNVLHDGLEEKIYDLETKSLSITPTEFEWVDK